MFKDDKDGWSTPCVVPTRTTFQEVVAPTSAMSSACKVGQKEVDTPSSRDKQKLQRFSKSKLVLCVAQS